MPDLDTPLDRSIRELVARAVADAPPAPAIDAHAATAAVPASRRTRWIVTGLAGLSIAAAVLALLFVSRPDEVSGPPLVPATRPDESTAPTTAATVVPTTAPPPAPTTPSASDPGATDPGATDPGATDPGAAGLRVVAGPGGVTVSSPDGPVAVVTSDPMAVAVPAPDGRVFMQRGDVIADPSADTTIFVVAPGASELVGVPDPAAFAGSPKRLHAAAIVDGELALVVETRPATCAAPDACDGTLWAFRPDSGATQELITNNVWEAGWSDLSLAATGVVVGDALEGAGRAPFSLVVPGGTGTAADFASLGLESAYFDCSTCPQSFRIDPTGQFVGWIEHDPMVGTTVAVAKLDDATVVRTRLVTDAGEPCCASRPLIPVFPSLALDQPVMDGAHETVHGNAVISETDPTSERPPLLIELRTGTTTTGEVGTTTRFG